jgi:hypothetical protein
MASGTWAGNAVQSGSPRRIAASCVADVLSFERTLPREHLVEHAPERPDVAPLVGRLPLRLFRCHVCGGAENDARLRHRGRRDRRGLRDVRGNAGGLQCLRQPKIEYLHHAIVTDLDIRRLQIAMDDALLVRRCDRLRDLPRDGQCVVERDCAARDTLCEVLTLDELQNNGHDAVRLFKTVDAADVGVVQRGEDFRLSLKTSEPVSVCGQSRREDLDGDLTFQLGVGRPIHLAHTAFTDLSSDLVDAEAGTGCERQKHRDYTGRSDRAAMIPPQ